MAFVCLMVPSGSSNLHKLWTFSMQVTLMLSNLCRWRLKLQTHKCHLKKLKCFSFKSALNGGKKLGHPAQSHRFQIWTDSHLHGHTSCTWQEEIYKYCFQICKPLTVCSMISAIFQFMLPLGEPLMHSSPCSLQQDKRFIKRMVGYSNSNEANRLADYCHNCLVHNETGVTPFVSQLCNPLLG